MTKRRNSELKLAIKYFVSDGIDELDELPLQHKQMLLAKWIEELEPVNLYEIFTESDKEDKLPSLFVDLLLNKITPREFTDYLIKINLKYCENDLIDIFRLQKAYKTVSDVSESGLRYVD